MPNIASPIVPAGPFPAAYADTIEETANAKILTADERSRIGEISTVVFDSASDASAANTGTYPTVWDDGELYKESVDGIDLTTGDGRTWYRDTSSGRSFDARDYIPAEQMVHILNNDIDSQDASVVSAALQEMHDAAMDFVVSGGNKSYAAVIRYGGGKFAINDEFFSEDFAQALWELNAPTGSVTFFTFDFTGSVFQCKGWPSHKTKRSSGYWLEEDKTDEWVPSCIFRWEQPSKRGYGPAFTAGTFIGEDSTTDPIPFYMWRLNLHTQTGVVCKDFANTGRLLNDMNNSDFVDDEFASCGWQPTACGGTGFLNKDATISTVGSGGETVVTATEDIFLPEHVGRYLHTSDGSSSGGISFGATISGYNGPRSVTLSEETPDDVTDAFCSFNMISGSTTAGSNILTLDSTVSHDLEGRYVHVYKAGSEKFSDRDLLVCRVLEHDGTTLTLSANAGNTISNTPIAVAPTVFTGKTEEGSATSNINDVTFVGSRIVHQIFDSDFGGSITEILTDWFSVFTYVRKLHGTPANWNNFGGNASIFWADGAKVVNSYSAMFEWGQWHPDLAKMVFTGDRCNYYISGARIGDVNTAWAQAYWLIDPLDVDDNNFQVYFAGHINSKPSQVSGPEQETLRLGVHGSADMLLASGPLKSRGKFGFPEMPPTPMRTAYLYTDTPNESVVFIDPDDGTKTNLLDAIYTQGDWDVVIFDESGNTSPTTVTGSYTLWANGKVDLFAPKIGPVDVTGMVASDALRIELPFTSKTPERSAFSLDISGMTSVNGSGSQLVARVENNSNYLVVYNVGITSTSNRQRIQDIDGGTIQALSGSYLTSE